MADFKPLNIDQVQHACRAMNSWQDICMQTGKREGAAEDDETEQYAEFYQHIWTYLKVK